MANDLYFGFFSGEDVFETDVPNTLHILICSFLS